MSMLSFAPVALPVALVGTVMIYLTALRILRGTRSTATKEKEWRVEIPVSRARGRANRRAAKLGIFRTQEYELVAIQRWGEPIDPDERIEAGDLLVFAATEEGIAAIWRTPLFGMSAQRLYAVSVTAGEHGTLHDFEQRRDAADHRRAQLAPAARDRAGPGRDVLRRRHDRRGGGRATRRGAVAGRGQPRAPAGARPGSPWPCCCA